MAETYTSGVWTVKPGEEDAFVEAWAEFVVSGKEMPGSGDFKLVRDLDRPGRYLSFARWESFEAQQAWRDKPEMQEGFRRTGSHCDDFQTATHETVKTV